MACGIEMAVDLIEERKQLYKAQGIDYYRPWIFMIADGGPMDMKPGDPAWTSVVKKIHDGEAARKFSFFLIATGQADMRLLERLAPPNRGPLRLATGCWKELFQWLSASQSAVSGTEVGDPVELPPIPDCMKR
jgi:uncharacterized protein YegL